MRKNVKLFLKSFIISLMFCAVLVGIGYYFIQKNLEPVVKEEEHIPYTQESPESKGVLLKIDNDETFFYLDFAKSELYVSINPESENENKIYGYDIDYKIESDYNLIRDIVDYVDGIELQINDLTFRYTGIQISQIYNTNIEQKREILKQICKKIGENGVALDFFANIIQNSTTNLTIPDCYFWDREIDGLCENLKFID